ncbi:MAG: 16S rRNA (cytosine(967)-C(5))-methyltransferase RsmB [Oscillospiraceae bacterium]|jgi:16S rRNA (cytosine967-C5)-methyltransferase|nr:16S rRNA (cytosine(967)-C(5))-methyltransferase RsmB [Oscillospiraceae bacterium]
MPVDIPRRSAFNVLLRIAKDNAYSNLALDSALSGVGFDQQRFCAALVYGVSERQITLDWQLSRQLNKPLKQLRPPVLTALRMGTYQLYFMDGVPDSAAVNSTVQLLKDNGCAYASGLANAVLRKCAAAGLQYPAEGDNAYLSIRYSVPEWLIALWGRSYGIENTRALLAELFSNGETYIRVNTAKTTREELIAALAAEGVNAVPSPALPNAVILPKGTAPQKTCAFANGLYHVQGLASQYCVAALDPKPGEHILDMCAAPGGKTFTIAQELLTNGTITALELHPRRAELIRQGAARLKLENITTHVADASKVTPQELGTFDAVLCDVPCSGLGIIAKKPDIRHKEKSSLDNLPNIQYTLLRNAAVFVRPGGRLVYSTCTLNPAENEDLCSRFLAEFPTFAQCRGVLPQLSRYVPDSAFLSLFPHLHGCDGFFIAAFVKEQERQENG